jgi:hypothetical protein
LPSKKSKKEKNMEVKLRHLDLSVTRVRDIRKILQAWDEALILGEAFGCTPGHTLDALPVRASLSGWVPRDGVALNLAAHEPILEHLLELLDIADMDLQQVAGLWRYRVHGIQCA